MIEQLRAAVGDALRDRYGTGAVIDSWGSAIERTWSWQIPISVRGALRTELLLKVPRWPDAMTLDRAVAAGEQSSTVAEFEALVSMGDAVAQSGDPGLAVVEAVAFLPAVNGILMRRFDGRSLGSAARRTFPRRDIDALFSRVGRLIVLIHGIGSPSRRPIDGEALAAEADRLAVTAVEKAPPELSRLLRRLAKTAAKFDGMTEPVGTVHGDLNMGNILVDRSARVAAIDFNIAQGPQLADVALLAGDVRFDRRRLATAGRVGSNTRRDRWVATFEAASGVEDEAALPFRDALALGERWLRIEAETSGFARAALLPARRLLGRELRRRVEALAG